MTEQTQAPAFADEQAPMSIGEAFRATRPPAIEKPEEQDNEQAAPSQDDAGAAHENSADDADAAAQDEPRGEADGQEDAADDQPPIAPPRSWTKDEKKAFEALPRELQQSIAERERARDVEIGRRQNEIAEYARASQAEKQAAEQARKAYEERLPLLVQAIQSQVNTEFADIQTWDDVQKMAREDPARYNAWHAMRSQQEAFQNEAAAAHARRQEEQVQQARAFYEAETRRFNELAPEFADPKRGAELRQEAVTTLQELGFAPEEIGQAWNTGGAIPVHDHRFQLLVRDATRYRAAQKNVTKAKTVAAATPKPAPQVQRPGPATSPKDAVSEHVRNLDSRLTRTGKVADALALMKAARR